MSLKLTKHQQAAYDKSIKILKKEKRLLIFGSAGVGKTTITLPLVESFPEQKNIYITAPTNKAVRVIKEKFGGNPSYHYTTIHKALKLERKRDNTNGKMYFVEPKKKSDIDFLVIDEVSMLNKDIIQFCNNLLKKSALVLYLGDIKQLNPIGEDISAVFSMDIPKIELTEIIRQKKGNSIINLSRDIDKIDDFKIDQKDDIKDGCGYRFINGRNKATSLILNNIKNVKYLSWTNDDVISQNNKVRNILHGSFKERILVGELLIFNAPYKNLYQTNDEMKVRSVKKQQGRFTVYRKKGKIFKESYIYYSVNKSNIKILADESVKTFKRNLKGVFRLCKQGKLNWDAYYDLKETFADVYHSYAMTIHKSQGSTIKHVILNYTNIMKNSDEDERKRLLYTGMTRASDELIWLVEYGSQNF